MFDPMEIRNAHPGEADRIGEIDVQAFTASGYGDAHNMADDEAFCRKRSDNAAEFCRRHPDWTFVAVEEDALLGFVTIEHWPEREGGRIENNAVLPDYSGRGISTQLVRHAVDALKRLEAKHLTVCTAFVPAARRVYEKAGFTLVRREGNHYHYEMRLV